MKRIIKALLITLAVAAVALVVFGGLEWSWNKVAVPRALYSDVWWAYLGFAPVAILILGLVFWAAHDLLFFGGSSEVEEVDEEFEICKHDDRYVCPYCNKEFDVVFRLNMNELKNSTIWNPRDKMNDEQIAEYDEFVAEMNAKRASLFGGLFGKNKNTLVVGKVGSGMTINPIDPPQIEQGDDSA